MSIVIGLLKFILLNSVMIMLASSLTSQKGILTAQLMLPINCVAGKFTLSPVTINFSKTVNMSSIHYLGKCNCLLIRNDHRDSYMNIHHHGYYTHYHSMLSSRHTRQYLRKNVKARVYTHIPEKSFTKFVRIGYV